MQAVICASRNRHLGPHFFSDMCLLVSVSYAWHVLRSTISYIVRARYSGISLSISWDCRQNTGIQYDANRYGKRRYRLTVFDLSTTKNGENIGLFFELLHSVIKSPTVLFSMKVFVTVRPTSGGVHPIITGIHVVEC